MRTCFDMMRAEFIDGFVAVGETYEDLVGRLWHSAHFDESKTVAEYMEAVASRTVVQVGQPISYEDAESFVRELHRVGIITKLETEFIN